MRGLIAYAAVAMTAVTVSATPAVAQRGRANEPQPARPPMRQQALVKQVRQAFAGVVRRQLNLTDEQSTRLQDIDAKYQRQRNDLLRDERTAREELRTALSDSSASPDAAKVDASLQRLIQAQRKRAELLEAEQKELSGFLNPVQRAKYLALKEQLQRRVGQLRQQDPGGARGGAVPPPPKR